MLPSARPARTRTRRQDSATTSLGDLSGRSPRQEGWRSRPSRVHSEKATSPTTSGRTQRASFASRAGNGWTNGEAGAACSSVARSLSDVDSVYVDASSCSDGISDQLERHGFRVAASPRTAVQGWRQVLR